MLQALETLVEPTTRGDPMSPLRWTCKSTRKLAEALQRQGHRIGARTVARLLHALDYRLQANRKTLEGSSHPDRNAQFAYINAQVRAFQARDQPVVSIDAKKKALVGDFASKGQAWQPQGTPEEVGTHDFPDPHLGKAIPYGVVVSIDAKKKALVGDFASKGQAWQPQGTPEEVGTHDFPDPHLGKAIPYGVYDRTTHHGWVSVGIDHDTAQFATATLRRWWQAMGSQMSPQAETLVVTADSGGSNNRRRRLWKVALQAVADEIGLPSRSVIFPQAQASGIRLSSGCFATSQNIGVGVRCATLK